MLVSHPITHDCLAHRDLQAGVWIACADLCLRTCSSSRKLGQKHHRRDTNAKMLIRKDPMPCAFRRACSAPPHTSTCMCSYKEACLLSDLTCIQSHANASEAGLEWCSATSALLGSGILKPESNASKQAAGQLLQRTCRAAGTPEHG